MPSDTVYAEKIEKWACTNSMGFRITYDICIYIEVQDAMYHCWVGAKGYGVRFQYLSAYTNQISMENFVRICKNKDAATKIKEYIRKTE